MFKSKKLMAAVTAATIAMAGSASAITLRVDFTGLPVTVIGATGPGTILGGFTFDNETFVVSDVGITGINADYNAGTASVVSGRFNIDFTSSIGSATMSWLFLDSVAEFNAKIDEILFGFSRDPFIRADIREVALSGALIATGDGVAVQIAEVPVAPVPLPAGLPLLAAALGLLGLRRKTARA